MRSRSLLSSLLLSLLILATLYGCDVPKPPPEALTPTVAQPGELLAAVTSPTAIPGSDQPARGRIWFVRGDALWLAEIGGATKQMSNRPVSAPPAPSPDGRRVAFISGGEIYLLDAAGGEERRLVEADLTDRQLLAWSPDGTRLAYHTFDQARYGDEKVWQIAVDGGEPELLAALTIRGYRRGPSFNRVARWAPDMRRIAIGTVYGPIELLPLSSTAGGRQIVGGGEPDWAPDSRTLLLAESLSGALSLYDVVTEEKLPYRSEQRPVGTRMGEAAQAPSPLFDPSGGLILYLSQADDRPAVAIRSLAGEELLFVPGANNPSWSPYDAWFAYEMGAMADEANGRAWKSNAIAIINADGSGQAEIAGDARWPVWGR